jgi:hypothetical protein
MTELPDEAFQRSSALVLLKLGGLLREVGQSCFNDCELLETVEVEPGCRIRRLGVAAFLWCPNLGCLPNLRMLEVVGAGCFRDTGVRNLDFKIYPALREHGLIGASQQVAAESLLLSPHVRQPVSVAAANLQAIEWAAPALTLRCLAPVSRAVFTGVVFTCKDGITIRSMRRAQIVSERAALFGRMSIPANPERGDW